MDRPYLQDLRIRNYGCIQDASLTLSPLHALIGPNDSGKTTILRAIDTIAYMADQNRPHDNGLLYRAMVRSTQDAEVFLDIGTTPITHATLKSKAVFELNLERKNSGGCRWKSFWEEDRNIIKWQHGDWRSQPRLRPMEAIVLAIRNCTLLRLDPDALRAPRQLLQEGASIRFQDERGLGLPAIYDAIQNRDIEAFLALNAEMVKLFPDIKSIRLTNATNDTKAIGVNLTNGTFVPGESMSEGLLYYLAFAALRYIDQPAILLIEEPENGLHPARIAEVMRVLRELSKTTQIILATHSPLVVNELEPHEVSVVTRSRETGTHATLIKDTANFEERSKVYALGELWLSYANGLDEAPLISGGPRP
jgi:predicted ATPase